MRRWWLFRKKIERPLNLLERLFNMLSKSKIFCKDCSIKNGTGFFEYYVKTIIGT